MREISIRCPSLLGLVVHGDARPDSDVDLAAALEPVINPVRVVQHSIKHAEHLISRVSMKIVKKC